MAIDKAASFVSTLDIAKAAGATGIVVTDAKTSLWFSEPTNFVDWLAEMKALRDLVRARSMRFILMTSATGYGTPLLANDQSLTTGYPIVGAPMVVRNGVLQAESTASIENGSFESSLTGNSNAVAGVISQDDPGVRTFIDRTQAHDGSASFLATNNTGANSRIFMLAKVKPFQQYSLKFWMKSENLTSSYLGPFVASTSGQRELTSQHLSLPDQNGLRTYLPAARNLTTNWTEMVIPFNSQNETEVTFGFGAWAVASGKLWIDDVRVEATPTLNLIRRPDLPLSIRTTGGVITEGVDVAPIVDPLLGCVGYPGYYETYHVAPAISVQRGSRLREGDRVLLSGYHAQVTTAGQVGMSWQNEKVFRLIKRVYTEAAAQDLADGYLIDFEEIRTGGWEPADDAAGGTAASMGKHAQRIVSDAAAATGKPLYIWSDMLDPYQNAKSNFYQLKGTADGSWNYLSPNNVTIINWNSGSLLRDTQRGGPQSVRHFASLGFNQIIAGFYDEEVDGNYAAWSLATQGQPQIVGSMYTTWTFDYSKLSTFAKKWWSSPLR